MLHATAGDGTPVRVHDEGSGPPVLIVHPGLDDGRSYQRVVSRLTSRFRVVRLIRPQYRLDLPGGCAIAEEADHVLAVARALGAPSLLFGHSSGAVVALEAMVAAPECFSVGVLYEPPLVVGPPLGGEAAALGRAALESGKRSEAMTIFARDVVGVPARSARLSSLFIATIPRFRRLIRRQYDDLDALDALGCRLDVYARIELPIVLVGGEKSPRHLRERLDALEAVLAHAQRVVLAGRGHDANFWAPREVARIIASAGRASPT